MMSPSLLIHGALALSFAGLAFPRRRPDDAGTSP